MTAAHFVRRAWLSTGGTGAKNYDEFPDESVITDLVAENPASVLAVEMPTWTPEAREAGLAFDEALPAAKERLEALQQAGRFRPHDDVAVAYRITEEGQEPFLGLFAMVDTAQISSSPEEEGLVIRNEEVFRSKVEERSRLNAHLGVQLSPVLLLQTEPGLHERLAAAVEAAGEPALADRDEAGRLHEIWPVDDAELVAAAGSGRLVVADGNHRSLAAQVGGLGRFLSVITTSESIRLLPYNRLVSGLPGSAAQLMVQIGQIGAEVEEVDAPYVPEEHGHVIFYGSGRTWRVAFPTDGGTAVDALDHSKVEREVFEGLLGFEPKDPRITYVGGDYSVEWLVGQVDEGRADLAVIIAPVGVEDFVDINLRRLVMPRKSTWFVPKARAGLVAADVE
ncbi:DUF1015 family protein [Salininema proteolyticum]|uniref:DUF1015 family protein n=1 Tax=Salininema proteolyticum TaxID=1607685 RepID=A0ABV8U1V5_9ACTN